MTYWGEYAPYLSHIVAELTRRHTPMLSPLMIYYKIRLSSTVISTPDIIPVSSLLKAFISDPDPGAEAWKDSRPDPVAYKQEQERSKRKRRKELQDLKEVKEKAKRIRNLCEEYKKI